MFEIDSRCIFHTDLYEIVDSYKVLHWDGEPILYTGINKYGNRIIGSSVDEDDNYIIQRHFRIIISEFDYSEFICKIITYLELMEKCRLICIRDINIEDDSLLNSYLIDIIDIPKDYLPHKLSYCPDLSIEYSPDYSAILKGGIAEYNRGAPHIISIIISIIEKIFKRYFKLTRELITPRLLIAPTMQGSFELNFKIDWKGKLRHLYISEKEYNDYLNDYMKYCFNNLERDIGMICNVEEGNLDKFTILLDKYIRIMNSQTEEDRANLQLELEKALIYSYVKFVDLYKTVGKEYNSLYIVNKTKDAMIQIGEINFGMKEKLIERKREVDVKIERYRKSREPEEYRMRIISLNVETRKGIASVYRGENKLRRNRRIRILAKEELEKSKYMNSLSNNIDINVMAYPREEKSRFFRIEIIE